MRGRALLMAGMVLLCLVLAPLLAFAQVGGVDGAVPHAAQRYEGLLRREAQRVWGLQAPVATFGAQLHQESRWHPDARSPVGALGLAQVMPTTARWLGTQDEELQAVAPLTPAWSVRALVVYDLWLHQRVRVAADDCQRMAFALAAYNGGLGWVYRRQDLARRAGLDPGQCLTAEGPLVCGLNPGVTPAAQRENERYPVQVLAREALYASWGPVSCP